MSLNCVEGFVRKSSETSFWRSLTLPATHRLSTQTLRVSSRTRLTPSPKAMRTRLYVRPVSDPAREHGLRLGAHS